MPGWFALADELDRRIVAAAATSATPIEGGIVYRNERLPAVRHLNSVALTTPLATELTAQRLVDLADEWLHGCPGRSLRISDETGAERIAPGLASAGWERRRTVLMVRPGAAGPALPARDPRAREVSEREHNALMRAIFTETDLGPGAPADLPELLVAVARAQHAGLAGQRFAAGEDGDLQSMCELFLDPDVQGTAMGMVEQVATLESHRVRGLAKGVTVAAMAAAIAWGAELIMVPADREDWPQLIYSGLGCEVVGTVTSFFLPAPSAGDRA
ncbi:MAG TPA: hypothetical protein VFN55_19455 [Solirubrobacteraceae bacterium]|nr:hypothetical protein [Solirubrobacteraceae bacterium]